MLTSIRLVLVLAVVGLVVGSAFVGMRKNIKTNQPPQRYEFTTQLGDPLFIKLPSDDGGGGFIGAIYEPKHGHEVGSFTTDNLVSGETIFDVLIKLAEDGFADVESVRGTFVIQDGTIVDNHVAHLAIVGPASTVGYDFVVEATANGVITEGTGKYHRGSGTSTLSMTMEVDAEEVLPVRALEGASFVFVLE